MRQQYHSRMIDGERLIWDINLLVEMARDLPIQKISLNDIKELDEQYWYEGEDSPKPTCRNIAEHAQLIEETSLDHPIILCSKGRVMDGMHRICKAVIKGYETIDAVQFEKDPAPDYKNVSLNDLPYND